MTTETLTLPQIDQHRIPLFVLASTLTAYPQVDFEEEIHELLSIIQSEINRSEDLPPNWPVLKDLMLSYTSQPQCVNDLRSDYIDIFDRGHVANPIYETEYGRNRSISKTNELADLNGFYIAFGLKIDGQPEMQDHVSVELEFYAYLLMKQQYLDKTGDQAGCEIVLDARKKFLHDHLGCFISAIGNCPDVKAHPFYSEAFQWSQALVAQECLHLGVVPAPISFFTNESEPEELNCAVLGGCRQ